MRLLFVHDHRFVQGPDGAMLTVGSFPRSVWERYLKHFDELVVVARDGGPSPACSELARSDDPRVRFALVRSHGLAERLLGIRGEASRVIARETAMADAVVVRVPSDLGNLAARMASAKLKPLAVEAVGCALDGYCNHGSRLSRLYAPLAMRRMQRVIAAAEQVLYVTTVFLQRRYPTKGSAHGVSDVEIVPLSEDERTNRAARREAIARGRPPVIGTVASLRVRSKGIQTAIAALARLKAEGQTPEYRVLGAGDREPWLAIARNAGIAECIHFDGSRASGAGVREWLSGIDLHIQPSFQEGLPRATVEAMSRGCACLGSTAGGLPELIPVDRLHPPGDDAALARLLRRYCNDSDALAEASAADLAMSEMYLPAALEPVRDDFYGRLAQRAAAAD